MDSESGENVKADQGVLGSSVKLTPQRLARKRMPYSGCKKVNSGFKSPVQSSSTKNSAVCLETEIKQLQTNVAQLESEISQLDNEGVGVQELDQHIDLLHEYNDIKDIAQTLLGRLAGLRGVTTRDLYSHFSMELDD
ncbi:DNA repair protein SWI5 homolog [Trichomycterus rosablanca]|uniref:DNA repair protein SWI5 homolog n=1 Tax=Trichomycterus rosablanca TaxID=2290929 RepID=UPI002F3569C8